MGVLWHPRLQQAWPEFTLLAYLYIQTLYYTHSAIAKQACAVELFVSDIQTKAFILVTLLGRLTRMGST